jgi:hypothetical protein
MRKVVDSNYLRTDELRDYLSTSRTNKAAAKIKMSRIIRLNRVTNVLVWFL